MCDTLPTFARICYAVNGLFFPEQQNGIFATFCIPFARICCPFIGRVPVQISIKTRYAALFAVTGRAGTKFAEDRWI